MRKQQRQRHQSISKYHFLNFAPIGLTWPRVNNQYISWWYFEKLIELRRKMYQRGIWKRARQKEVKLYRGICSDLTSET